MKLSRFVFSSLLMMSVSGASLADESHFYNHGTSFRNDAAQIDRAVKARSLAERLEIVPDHVDVSIVREDYMTDNDQFALRLSVPDMLTGCYILTPLQYQASFIDPLFLEIKVHHYRKELVQTDTPHLECPTTYNKTEAIIPLSRKDLLGRGTQYIRMSTDNFSDIYDLDFSEAETIKLRPQSMVVFKTTMDPITRKASFDITKGNRVRLYVPMGRESDNVAERLKMFARQKGLTISAKQTQPAIGEGPHALIVHDEEGALLRGLENSEILEVGSIDVMRQVRNADGSGQQNVPLTVFAKAL